MVVPGCLPYKLFVRAQLQQALHKHLTNCATYARMSEPSTKKRKTVGAHSQQDGPTVTDPRFANIQSDPRYRLPSKRNKVTLDKRFSSKLRDDDFSRKAKVDRYGRRIEADAERKRLKRKYEFEEEDESIDAVDVDDDVQRELARVEKSHDPLREGRDVESSSDEPSSDEEEDDEEELEDDAMLGDEQVDVPMGEVSSRVAVVNLDWDNIRAEDIMAVVSSFLPAVGRLLKVSIYPSQFGKERMEREELEGPPREIFATTRTDDDISDSEDEEDDEAIRESILRPDEGADFDSAALRRYQRERLGYYYAILTFSSPSVAKTVYDAIDGAEYMSSANFFDLRFVPDDTDFSTDKPREECEKIPEAYKPNNFVTEALQHSKVKLTWDAEDGGRKEAQARAFKGGRKEIDENDLKAYLGSDTSDDDDEDEEDVFVANGMPDATTTDKPISKKEAERQRMRAALGLGPEPEKRSKKSDGPVGNVQITFSSGLSGTTDSRTKRTVFENSPELEETSVEKYVRKERERKQRRKEKLKSNPDGEATPAEQQAAAVPTEEAETPAEAELGFDDPFFAEPTNDKAGSNKLRKEERVKKKREREAEEAASAAGRAKLEALMADDKAADNGMRHFDMNEIEKAEKKRAKKGAKKGGKKGHRKDAADADDAVGAGEDDFTVDTADPRFNQLFESHEYAIDPNNPRFKGTRGMKTLLEENKRRKSTKAGENGTGDVADREQKQKSGKNVNAGSGGVEVKSLVEKLKKKRT